MKLLTIALLLAASAAHAASPTGITSTRVTTYDFQTQDANGARIADYQRFDTAIVGCLNDAKCVFVAGGKYRITRPGIPVNCVVSAWSAYTYTAWVASGSTETRTGTRTRTVTTPAANGGTACPALSETITESRTVTPPIVNVGTAALSWSAVTQYTNGSAITGAVTYRVYQGTSATNLARVAEVSTLTHSIANLAKGTYYFAVSAVASGVEGGLSAVGSKVIP